jgi:proteasome lid subunit RPN8/RPN11
MPLLPPPQVRLSTALGEGLQAAALAARPREFVAALGGRIDRAAWCIEAVVPLPNVAVAADRFAVPASAFAAAEAELRRRGLAWLGFVHSHVDGSTAPSRIDREQLWRHCLQLIVGAGAAARGGMRCHWSDGPEFGSLPLAIGDLVAS